MRIAVWRTGHEIADKVAAAVCLGIDGILFETRVPDVEEIITLYDAHIGYGILRGMDNVFKICARVGKPWFNIDRGYWKPGHYDGYYRISLNGTQQTFGLDKLEPDYKRWDALGLEIERSAQPFHRDCDLVCLPTDYVKNFFGVNTSIDRIDNTALCRPKDCARPLQNDLNRAKQVITFNSSVGWEALRQGIPVVSDPNHSIVGVYEKHLDGILLIDYEARRRLFGIQASLQLTLAEISEGKLWPLLNRLMFI